MDLSLSEYRALVAKAFRGAGYPWGLAEEGAVAAQALASNDIAASAAVVSLLRQAGPVPTATTMPDMSWGSTAGWLCPISTGAALADTRPSLDPSGLELAMVAEPALMGPLVQRLASDARSITIRWDNGALSCDASSLTLSGAPAAGTSPVTIESTEVAAPTDSPRCTRVEVDEESLAALTEFAQLTYAPATEASRLAGAGSGLNDND